MKFLVRIMAGALLLACMAMQQAGAQAAPEIGGQSVVTLHRAVASKAVAEFTGVTIAPGRGMDVLEITANLPGKGNINVLATPGTAAAAKMVAQHDDPSGMTNLSIGAAFLIPYPNRVRGKATPDGKSITTEWKGHTLTLPASPWGRPSDERPAIHGLIFKSRAEDVQVKDIPDGQQMTGVIHAGDFGGHWLSKTDLKFTITLTGSAVDVTIDARNVGNEAEPMAIGWHPGFALPSGNRAQVRVQLPASSIAEVENYQNVLPTGKIKPVDGTRFDLRAEGGVVLGKSAFDDNWSGLERKKGSVTVRVIDPAAHYGVSVAALSPTIKTIQLYTPLAMPMVAVEPQFNFVDPFGKEWGSMDTGMVTLKPGQSTKWHVRLGLFEPGEAVR